MKGAFKIKTDTGECKRTLYCNEPNEIVEELNNIIMAYNDLGIPIMDVELEWHLAVKVEPPKEG
jgi:hypothetical protein